MEFRRSKRIKIDQSSLEYPHPLQLYLKPPTGEISLEEFESVAYDRLKLLRILEQATLMGHKIYSQEWKIAVIGYLKKDGLRKYVNLIQSNGVNTDTDVAIRREDHISHFILRLCYCRSLDLRTWFIARENELFKLRFSNLTSEGLRNLIKTYNLSYSPISEKIKDQIKEGLLMSTYGFNLADVENRDFYKVPFQEVCDLISKRMVYLKTGCAYIPSTELVSCLVSMFRSNLNEELTQASKILPFIDDERIIGLLQSLHNTYTGKDYTIAPDKKGKVDLEDFDMLSQQSFPLCMRHLYDVIKQTHHLKHYGRLQFGLFLKGIGLTLEDAITFWRAEFTKLMDEDKFNKGYLYNIKHTYGCIGKMTNYTPYSCTKIISFNVGPGECHGCPFKHWELENLRKKMVDTRMTIDGMKDVLETVRNGHYQIACSKYFIHTHGGIEPKALINHPNQYFEESREIRTNLYEKFDNRNINKRKNKNTISESVENRNEIVKNDEFGERYLDSGIDWNIEVEEGSSALNGVQKNNTNNDAENMIE